MTHICGKCDQLCDVIDVDQGGYENFWGAKVWHEQMETVSECCHDDAYTLKEWLKEGFEIPNDCVEAFADEGLLQ